MEKTLAPTQRRLRRAILEGDSALSLPVVRGAVFVVFALLLPGAAGALATRFRELLRGALERPDAVTAVGAAGDVALIAGPLLAAAALSGLVAGLTQTGGLFRWTGRRSRAVTSPLTWLRTYESLRGLAVTVGLLGAGGATLSAFAPRLAATVSGEQGLLGTTAALAGRILWSVAFLIVLLSLVDLAVKRAAWIERWRMSPRDVRDERRESEGDPDMKRARRRAHEELERMAPPRPDQPVR